MIRCGVKPYLDVNIPELSWTATIRDSDKSMMLHASEGRDGDPGTRIERGTKMEFYALPGKVLSLSAMVMYHIILKT